MHRTREAWLEESHQAGDESLELSGKGKTEELQVRLLPENHRKNGRHCPKVPFTKETLYFTTPTENQVKPPNLSNHNP